MSTRAEPQSAAADANPAYEAEVIREIAYLESRLSEMGASGDCAYERALAQAFSAMLEERRRELADLRPTPTQA